MENFQTAFDKPQGKNCILSTLAATSFILGIALFFATGIFGQGILAAIGGGFVISSSLIAIAALIRIGLKENLSGRGLAVVVLIPVCFILVLIGGAPPIRTTAYNLMCGTNMGGLGKALAVYANDYDGKLPTAAMWCDLLVAKADVSTGQFICFNTDDRKGGESSFAMNRAAADKKLAELPKDLVVLFETNYGRIGQRDYAVKSRWFATQPEFVNDYKNDRDKVYKDRWNQVGGPEILSIENHRDGCNVLFADSGVKFVLAKDLPKLRWQITNDANFVFPAAVLKFQAKTDSYKRSLLILICISVLLCTIVIACTCKIWQNWGLSLIIGACSAGVGAFWGMAAAGIFYKNEQAGIDTGLILGLLFGLSFVSLLIRTSRNLSRQKLMLYSVSLGMATGAICSTVLHLILIIISDGKIFYGIIAGLPFGIVSGAILGFAAGLLIKRRMNTTKDEYGR